MFAYGPADAATVPKPINPVILCLIKIAFTFLVLVTLVVLEMTSKEWNREGRTVYGGSLYLLQRPKSET